MAKAQNSGSAIGRYPFVDSATMTSHTGIAIPPGTFLDARVYCLDGGVNQHISAISLTNNGVRITIADESREICSGVVLGNRVILTDQYQRNVGMLFGQFAMLPTLSSADVKLSFDPTALPLVPGVVVPQPTASVEGLLNSVNDLFTGDIWLVGEQGVVLTVSGHTITVHVTGDKLFVLRDCVTEQPGYTSPVPLRTLVINGVTLTPDTYGNVNVLPTSSQAPDNVARVLPVPGGIEIASLGTAP